MANCQETLCHTSRSPATNDVTIIRFALGPPVDFWVIRWWFVSKPHTSQGTWSLIALALTHNPCSPAVDLTAEKIVQAEATC
eukprot:6214176-Pyramimonas_sp.AAC.2